MALIRSFFALSVSEALERQLAGASCELSAQLGRAPLRWVPPENYHITLAFLGDIPKDALPALQSITEGVASRSPVFDVAVGDIGWFPSTGKPRHLVAEVMPSPALTQLHSTLLGQLAGAGFDVERRRFRPHITLARARRGLVAAPFEQPLGPAHYSADELVLFQSELSPKGSRYSPLCAALLGAD